MAASIPSKAPEPAITGEGALRPAPALPVAWRVSPVTDLERAMRQHGPGRWHADGQCVVYASATPELAVLEALAHLHEDPDACYWICRLDLPADHAAQAVHVADLPHGWQQRSRCTRAIGARWLERGDTLALHVPSALVSEATNILLNPAHAQHLAIDCQVLTQFLFDPRLERLRDAGPARRDA